MNSPALVAPPELNDAPAQSQLFARYVKALALLCECQSYVDEPDYEAQIEALLREACAADDIRMQHIGGRFEISLPDAVMRRMACAS